MNDTAKRVHQFMLDYQKDHDKPPTLDDIQAAVGTLNWRSSAKAALDTMVENGRVTVDGDEGESRRYHAVKLPVVALIEDLWPMNDRRLSVNPVFKGKLE